MKVEMHLIFYLYTAPVSPYQKVTLPDLIDLQVIQVLDLSFSDRVQNLGNFCQRCKQITCNSRKLSESAFLKCSEFQHQSCYYIHIQTNTLGKGMNFLILFNTTNVLLQGWLWH